MQQEIIITIGLYILGAALLAYSLFRAITIAYRRGISAGVAQAAAVHEPLMQAQKRATAAAWEQLDNMSEQMELAAAKANRELFALKVDSAAKIEELQQQTTKSRHAMTMTLQLDSSALRTLARIGEVLLLAAETFTALRAEHKAQEARQAARDCLELAENIKTCTSSAESAA